MSRFEKYKRRERDLDGAIGRARFERASVGHVWLLLRGEGRRRSVGDRGVGDRERVEAIKDPSGQSRVSRLAKNSWFRNSTEFWLSMFLHCTASAALSWNPRQHPMRFSCVPG